MRIAVFHNLPSGGGHRVLCEQLRRLGGDIAEVFTFSGSADAAGATDAPVREYKFIPRRLLGSPLGRLNGAINVSNLRRMRSACMRVARDIDGRGFDVILVHPCSVSQAPPVLEYLSTPSVYYCHEPFRSMHEALQKGGIFPPLGDPLRALYTWYAISSESRALQAATRVLCNSAYTREYLLRSYGVDSAVNYPGVDTGVFRPLGLERERVVLSVGRLSPLKGHEFVIDALAKVDSALRPVLGLVCESGSEESKQRLQDRAQRQNVSLVFHESVGDQRLAELYSRAALTVVAHVLEPLGLVALESMACETPVVAVAEAGLRETVVDGVTGLLCNRDETEFGTCVQRLLGDRELAAKMGTAGRELVCAKWTWERSIEQLTSTLRSCAGGAC